MYHGYVLPMIPMCVHTHHGYVHTHTHTQSQAPAPLRNPSHQTDIDTFPALELCFGDREGWGERAMTIYGGSK